MDITEIPCKNGKLYLAPVLDCYDGSIRGFKMDTNMKAELCVEAFKLACRRDGARGMILHSDRGSQFTSSIFRNTLAQYEAIQSMSSVGRCYDNARMESFFATLKKEKLYQMETTKMTTAEVKTVIYRYIYYYNLRRIYSTNDGWPPITFRSMYYLNQKVA
jgi:transposase InsO family protein